MHLFFHTIIVIWTAMAIPNKPGYSMIMSEECRGILGCLALWFDCGGEYTCHDPAFIGCKAGACSSGAQREEDEPEESEPEDSSGEPSPEAKSQL
jgi:hypothetical protein